jgi:TfoX/Sxy family transcriptional regulator of competence genes
MPYSHSLADRVRQALRSHRNITERKMFGSIVFLLHGNMLVGVWQASLIVRLGPEQAAKALKQEFVREFDMTGRPMKGWIMVEPDGLDSDRPLAEWIEKAMQFVKTLPHK